MTLKYEGIAVAGIGSPVAISASALWAWDAIITATSTATITDAEGTIMATLVAGVPFFLPGAGFGQWGDQPQINLAQYSANTAGGQTVYVAYSVRA